MRIVNPVEEILTSSGLVPKGDSEAQSLLNSAGLTKEETIRELVNVVISTSDSNIKLRALESVLELHRLTKEKQAAQTIVFNFGKEVPVLSILCPQRDL